MDYYNPMKEFEEAGEAQLMDRLMKFKFSTIFDVGANIGEWTKMVHDGRQPWAFIHCFEPMPRVYRKLLANVLKDQIMPNPFGLSDKIEMLDMLFDDTNDRLTTPCLELAREKPSIVPLLMVDGDSYCQSRNVEHIDFLKIDTEGHEFKVLKGFHHMLQSESIDIIQFEYGYANVLTKDLLIDFYRLLIPLGYTIGKLSPNGVDFKTYGLLDEDFKGPNYVAVRSKLTDVISEIQAS